MVFIVVVLLDGLKEAMFLNRLCKKYGVFPRKREMSSILSLFNALGLCESVTPVKS